MGFAVIHLVLYIRFTATKKEVKMAPASVPGLVSRVDRGCAGWENQDGAGTDAVFAGAEEMR